MIPPAPTVQPAYLKWLYISTAGAGGQQLVTMAEAGRMLAPLVAEEVERETRKIEIRMQVGLVVVLSVEAVWLVSVRVCVCVFVRLLGGSRGLYGVVSISIC